MRIVSIEYVKHELIFKNVYTTSGSKASSRRVYFIKISIDDGNCYYGECSPLPQFGSEDYPEVEMELERLTELKGIPFEATNSTLGSITKLPTVRYALEQAIFQMLAPINNLPASFTCARDINVNALIELLSEKDTMARASKIRDEGFTVVKLKAGRDNFEDDLDIISKLHNKFGDSLKIRLDVNGKWSLEEAEDNISRLTDFNIEYIEQPIKNIDDLIKLSNISSIPLAVDESIRTIENARLILDTSCIKHLVLKPMLLGGYFSTIEIAETAKAKNAHVILSSSLESNLGRRHLIAITSALGEDLTHGLGTSGLFSNDPIPDISPVKGGKIHYSPGLFATQDLQSVWENLTS